MKSLLVFLASAVFASAFVGQLRSQDESTQESPKVNFTPALPPGVLSMPVGMPMYGFSPGGMDESYLLMNPSVLKNLELVEDQISKIRDLQKRSQEETGKVWQEYAKANNDPQLLPKIQQRMRDVQSDQKKAMGEILLPHQQDRIKQVSRQMQMQGAGTSSALQNGQLADELNITDEQKKKFAEIQQKLFQQISEQTKKLQDSAKKEALNALTAEHRTKLNEITGEEFKNNANDWQDFYKNVRPAGAIQSPTRTNSNESRSK